MNQGNHWSRITVPGLHLLAALALLVTTVTSTAAAPTIEEAATNGVWSLGISASTYPSQQDADSYTNSAFTFGARFVVTSEAGDYIGECTLEQVPDPSNWHNCRVDVPSDRISLVWEDLDSLPPGYAPIENPITFDPTVFTTGPHNIHAWFNNAPVEAAVQTSQQAEMKSMSIIPVVEGGSSVVGVGFSVTAENGTFLGSCVVPTDFPGGYIPNCSVDVPQNTTVAVWFDPTASSAELTPVEDPVYFDTSTEDNAQMWGPAFAFEPIGETASTAAGSSGGSSSQLASAPVTDVLSLLPEISDVPSGLVETGRQTRTLPDVVANYTDAAETTQHFTQWGWEQNAIASFALPSNQGAQSGEVNGVYVSIHRFGSPEAGRAALDFSIAEQAAGTSLQEIDTRQFGEYTRALYGSMDYGNETTLLTQQGGLLIRVSAAMLDGDPTAEAESIMQGIVLKATSTTETGTEVISPDSSGGANSAQRTWTASIQVTNCDAARANCEAASGIVINISLASGEFLGSCTLGEPEMSPWGVAISVCTIPGLPYQEDFVATQDPSTIPAGYEPVQASLTLRVDDIHPGGGDQPTFGFTNVRTDAGSSTQSRDTSTATGSATLLMTFRACPERFNPSTGDYLAECTIPLDAPDASFIYWGVKLESDPGGMYLNELDRQYNGAYVFHANSGKMDITLSYLSPVVRDAYRVIGSDLDFGDDHIFYLVDGETREVFIFYYYA